MGGCSILFLLFFIRNVTPNETKTGAEKKRKQKEHTHTTKCEYLCVCVCVMFWGDNKHQPLFVSSMILFCFVYFASTSQSVEFISMRIPPEELDGFPLVIRGSWPMVLDFNHRLFFFFFLLRSCFLYLDFFLLTGFDCVCKPFFIVTPRWLDRHHFNRRHLLFRNSFFFPLSRNKKVNGPSVGMSTKLLFIYVQINLDFVLFCFRQGVNIKVDQHIAHSKSSLVVKWRNNRKPKKIGLFFLRATVFLSYFQSQLNSRMKCIELLKRHL